MTVLLHLSDPHFGTEVPAVLDALLDFAHALQPDVCVLSGDLTQRATIDQFREAAAFLRRMPESHWLVQPGNHDLPLWAWWERIGAPLGRYRRVMGLADAEPSLELSGVQILCVDTTRWWRQQRGALSGRQIDAVATRLAEARPGVWRIVSCHHPLAVQREQDRPDRPWRHGRALQRWRHAGLDLLLCGHIHVPSLLPLHAADEPAPEHPAWLSQGGSASSRRLMAGQPNSVNVLRQHPEIGGGLARFWARWDYSAERRAFVEVERVGLGLPRDARRASPFGPVGRSEAAADVGGERSWQGRSGPQALEGLEVLDTEPGALVALGEVDEPAGLHSRR